MLLHPLRSTYHNFRWSEEVSTSMRQRHICLSSCAVPTTIFKERKSIGNLRLTKRMHTKHGVRLSPSDENWGKSLERSEKWTVVCQVRRKILTQSINQLIHHPNWHSASRGPCICSALHVKTLLSYFLRTNELIECKLFHGCLTEFA